MLENKLMQKTYFMIISLLINKFDKKLMQKNLPYAPVVRAQVGNDLSPIQNRIEGNNKPRRRKSRVQLESIQLL